MVIKRIQYTTVPEFAETNKNNISKVMDELKALNLAGIRYSSYVLDDGKTFMHYVIFQDEQADKTLNNLESFKTFQTELKAAGFEMPPKVDNLTLVGSSYNLLD